MKLASLIRASLPAIVLALGAFGASAQDNLPEQADPHHRALHAGRVDRCDLPRVRRRSRQGPGPADDRREQARRRHGDRHADGEAGAGRWLHRPVRLGHDGVDHARPEGARLQHGGFRAGRHARRPVLRAADACGDAGEGLQGVRRLREEEPDQDELRDARTRRALARAGRPAAARRRNSSGRTSPSAAAHRRCRR